MKPYLLLKNKKQIKVKNINSKDIDSNIYIIELDNKYLNYFSSDDTTIQEIFFKGIFRKSKGLSINNDIVPTYNIVNNRLYLYLESELM